MICANVNSFLNNVLKELMAVLNAECGSLFLFDASRKELILDSYLNSRSMGLKNITRRVGEGISGKVVQSRAPVLVRDIDDDPRFNRNGFNHYNTKSFISVPLFVEDELLGVVNIADKSSREPFSEKDLQFATVLCKYACQVVEHIKSTNCVNGESEKERKQKELLEKYASVGKLAAGVVHEINNPLDGIMRYANIIFHQLETSSVVREYLLEIKKGLSRISNITNSLLEFSHLVNSDGPKFKKYVKVSDIIEDSLDAMKEKLNGSIAVIRHYEEGLPRVLDMGLYHVVSNLIGNAVDAMPQGGILEISTHLKDDLIYVNLKDTGTGISPEVKERIFEPFFTTKNIGKGTGLGLAICKEIVNKYEGAIEVHTAQGAGSTFSVAIPKKFFEAHA